MAPGVDSALDRLLTGSSLREPRVARKVVAVLAPVLLFSVAILVLVIRSMDGAATRVFGQALVCSALLAVVPVLLLYFLDRRERESPWLVAIAILWGALIATGTALPLNTWIIGAVAKWLEANKEIAAYLGPKGPLLVGAPLAAPLVEETIKAIGVALLFWFLRAEFDNVRDGFIYGALVGVGFTLFESALYVAQGYVEWGDPPWGLQLGARYALFGLAGHAMFTGIFGAFLGAARQTRRRWLQILPAARWPWAGHPGPHAEQRSRTHRHRPRPAPRASPCPSPGRRRRSRLRRPGCRRASRT